MKILVTGGTGYIGSHMVLKLIESGHKPVVLDNLSNSSLGSLNAIEEIDNSKVQFIKLDIRNSSVLDEVFKDNKFDSVMHFAALKSIGESVKFPNKYYDNNVVGSLNLLKSMVKYKVKRLVFSSSAAVYGDAQTVPIDENSSTIPTNPYGRTKLITEQMLRDLFISDPSWKISILRYFNPIGAHSSGLLGESPNKPHNIMPLMCKAALGLLPFLEIYGDDYNTKDGTGVRDYLHIEDLVNGHLRALESFSSDSGISTYNLGTGQGTSVLELIKAFESVSDKEIKIKFTQRREGDVATLFTNPTKAEKELDWRTEHDLFRMCEDTWRWLINNPNGYKK